MASGIRCRLAPGQTNLRTEGPKCFIHRDKEVVFVCSDCNELVCTTCYVSGHINHTLKEISYVTSQLRDNILDFVHDIEETTFPEIRHDLQLTRRKIAETEHNLGTVLPGQIQQYGELCKTDIDRYISILNCICREKKNKNMELILTYKNEIQNRYDCLVLMTKECKQVIQSGSPVLVFDKFKAVECLETEPLSMPDLWTPEYKQGTDVQQHIEQTIGTLDICTTAHEPGGIIYKRRNVLTRTWWKHSSEIKNIVIPMILVLLSIVVYYFTSLYIGIHCTKMSTLIPMPDGSAWFLDKKSNTTTQLLRDGTSKIIQHHTNILDISFSQKMGRLWLCSENIKTNFEVTPPSLVPCEWLKEVVFCLHVTKKDELVVGRLDLRILKKEETISLRREEKDFFFKSYVQITECPITGNIAVVRFHIVKPWMSDIAVYDGTLKVLFYHEMPGAGWNSVVSIAYDSFGNIVIGESRTQTVYMISGSTGQYIKHLFDVKGELSSIAIQTPCNILWAAVQQDIPPNRKGVKIKQRLLDLPNPSNECKRIRKNVSKTVYSITKDRERESYSVMDVWYML